MTLYTSYLHSDATTPQGRHNTDPTDTSHEGRRGAGPDLQVGILRFLSTRVVHPSTDLSFPEDSGSGVGVSQGDLLRFSLLGIRRRLRRIEENRFFSGLPRSILNSNNKRNGVGRVDGRLRRCAVYNLSDGERHTRRGRHDDSSKGVEDTEETSLRGTLGRELRLVLLSIRYRTDEGGFTRGTPCVSQDTRDLDVSG